MVFIGVCADDDGVKTYADKASMLSTGIDHLLYASANLQRGIDEIESRIRLKAGSAPAWKTPKDPAATYGTGLTASEVDNLAERFLRELS